MVCVKEYLGYSGAGENVHYILSIDKKELYKTDQCDPIFLCSKNAQSTFA